MTSLNKRFLFANVAAKIAVASGNCEIKVLEGYFRDSKVVLRHNKDALGWLGIIAVIRTNLFLEAF
jgi:hypothetical protein